MDIILLKDYDGLGETGDVVNVKPGFARNKLIPEGVALRASKRNLAIVKERKKTAHTRREREKATYDSLVKTLSKTEITIEAKVGEEDKMFGSVTSGTICDELKNQFDVELEKKRVHLPKAIKKVGEFDVKLNLHAEIEAELKVFVESENSVQTATEEASDTSVVG